MRLLLLLLLSFFHLCCGRAGSSFLRPGSPWQGISFSGCHVQAPRWQDAFILRSLNISYALSSEGEGRALPAPEDSLEGSVPPLLCWGIREIWDTPAPWLGWVHPPSPLTQHQYRLWLGWALRAGAGVRLGRRSQGHLSSGATAAPWTPGVLPWHLLWLPAAHGAAPQSPRVTVRADPIPGAALVSSASGPQLLSSSGPSQTLFRPLSHASSWVVSPRVPLPWHSAQAGYMSAPPSSNLTPQRELLCRGHPPACPSRPLLCSVTICVSHSGVSDSVTPWTVAHWAPLSMGFSRQEYWSG